MACDTDRLENETHFCNNITSFGILCCYYDILNGKIRFLYTTFNKYDGNLFGI